MMLIGVMFAAIGCTDQLAEDIKGVDGKVDAVEKTLTDLQSKYNELEALVNLKADAAALTAKVADLQAALADKAAASDLKSLQTKVADLETALESAKAQLSKYATTDALAAMEKKLQDQIDALKALEFATPEDVAAVKKTVDGLAADLEALEAKVATLETEQGKLAKAIEGILAKLNGVNFEDFLTAEDIAALVPEADLSHLATSDELAAANAAIASVEASLSAVINALIGDIYGLVQSLVFVPEYDDNKATLNVYTFDSKPVNDQVIVKGTYQLTPMAFVNRLGNDLEVKAVLQEVATRSAETAYVWAKDVQVTAINEATGKFDVEAIFSVDKKNVDLTKEYVLAIYVQHPSAASQEPTDELDDDMGVESNIPSATFVQNYMSSNFVNVHKKDPVAIENSYKLVKYNATTKMYVPYTRVDDAIEWSAVGAERVKSPFSGYEVRLNIDDEYLTLAEAAKLMYVAEADITPKYAQEEVLGVAANIKDFDYKNDQTFVMEVKKCEIHSVVDGTAAYDKTYSFVGEVTPATAKNFVGHRISVLGNFYFGDLEEEDYITVIDPIYTYTIDYRQANLNLVGVEGAHNVAWNLETAQDLSDNRTPNAKNLLSTLAAKNEIYTEYGIVLDEEIKDIDYKKVMQAGFVTDKVVATPEKVGNVTVDKPSMVITASTHIVADVAKVDITGYNFYSEAVNYDFTKTYTDYDSFTRIVYNFDLTLGEKPDAVTVTKDIKIPYTNSLATQKIEFQAAAAKAFAKYLPATKDKYSPYPYDHTNAGVNTLTYGTDPTKVTKTYRGSDQTNLDYFNDVLTVKHADVVAIYEHQNAAKKATITKTAKTWFNVDFVYTVNFEITEPQYTLAVLPTYVSTDAEGKYYAITNYTYVNDKYTVQDANMAHYFKVNGIDNKNKVQVKFTIKPVTGSQKSPLFQNNQTTVIVDVNDKGEIAIDKAVMSWKEYEHLNATVVAEIYLNDDYTHKFGPAVEVNVLAQDPLAITGKTVNVNRVPNASTTITDVRAAADVTIIGDANTITADRFATNASASSSTRKAAAYGANVTVNKAKTKVYYIDNGVEVALPTTNYELSADHLSIVLFAETTALQIPIYARFELALDYTLDGGVAKTAEVTYKFEYSK